MLSPISTRLLTSALVESPKESSLDIRFIPLQPNAKVMSEKVCKILLCPPPPAWGTPSRRGICDVDFSLSFYLIFHSRKNGSRLAYVPSVFSLATEPKRYTTESGDGIAPRMSKVRL